MQPSNFPWRPSHCMAASFIDTVARCGKYARSAFAYMHVWCEKPHNLSRSQSGLFQTASRSCQKYPDDAMEDINMQFGRGLSKRISSEQANRREHSHKLLLEEWRSSTTTIEATCKNDEEIYGIQSVYWFGVFSDC